MCLRPQTVGEGCTVVDPRLEQTVRQCGRDIDQLLGYLNQAPRRYIDDAVQVPTDWGYAGSLGYIRKQMFETASQIAGREIDSIEDLLDGPADQTAPINIPTKRPAGYPADHFREDLQAFQSKIDRRILDGYAYLAGRDYAMAGAMFDDVSDMQQASELLQQGEFERAATAIRNWDTVVRDQVPQRLYEALYRS